MTAFEARRLRHGAQILFQDGTPSGSIGIVKSVLNDWLTITWSDGTQTDLPCDDLEDVTCVSVLK